VPDEGVDDGPVLATMRVAVDPTDSLEDFAARMHAAEHTLLVETLAELCRPAPHLTERTEATL
jgi:phosphoribosylglycinamide formyltransferase-1